MIDRELIADWVIDALMALGGRERIVDLCRFVWEHHEGELLASGDLFFLWQYEARWAGVLLRKLQRIHATSDSAKGTWQLVDLEGVATLNNEGASTDDTNV